jgi:O-methyltransferase involved in polyketide biosynthesis
MVLVAMEQYVPHGERILTDDLALPILPFGYRAEVRLLGPFTSWIIKKSEQKVPGLWGGIMARKAYIDDIVSEAAGGQVEVVINLGAGFDTRAFRLPSLADVPAW